jgi:MoaA/NifB/PqqE/SkfB family radical SAM enzyme
MLIDYIKGLQKYRALKPFINLGKKYIYNPYLRSKLSFSDFPPEVWIENTNVCNANCVMCPREKLTRILGFMNFTLYEKLIKEISLYRDCVKRIHLHNYGEPLLDKELPRKIKLAKDFGIKHTYIVTNGFMLTPELSRQIIEAGLDEFKVSFYGTDPDTYNKTMRKLDFQRTLQNLKDFLAMREKLESRTPKIIIQYLPLESNKALTEEFYRIMKPLINENIGDSLSFFSIHNYGGGMSLVEKRGTAQYTCNYPWRTMVILFDGKVVLCCMDFNGVQVVGDVNINTIKKIWNGEKYRQVKEDFKKIRYKNYPVCMKCDLIR